ncbi:4Fe-4S dicluster domain-containing protein [Brevibacillus laterosporus]|uniref:2-oxoacid:acceptor oxidoreductase family protein n=1 Tax=Brevibacillus TaxID=55080 RepID=UPI00024044EA|nr:MULTISPECIES: 2-oxoacid:acceptor oxidoreductase family protein [Brevibacillus]AUM63921.1 4Fe-4S dicluster domain-containing protein [Brevibacillus laterosporus]MBA4531437.1 2-oxoacid:acceptor oxidoreductase family protein [Brevibacillus halotolerans]PCN44978.1 ferredoxin [Brevibacillus laterosporus]WPS88893.1 2-oxoacid:acceptor oxidoreductase family protein [Brevibacillus halotolerans]CCF12361.1 2-oxoacid:acceptor oxidoreductase, gamma subunit, pyruvate/2-ketoisovalerate family protein [Bre
MNAQTRLTKMNELGLYEIRLESIGGLGANLAGKMLAEAGVIHLGLNGSNFSSYGSEKKGSPVKAFVRFANPETKLRATSPIDEPHVVGVFHEAMLSTQNCTAGLGSDGILIVNTTKTPEEIKERTGLLAGTILCVDALGISLREKTRINTAMMGALCRVVDFLRPESVRQIIRETFETKYPKLVESNLRTFDAGYAEGTLTTFAATNMEEGKSSIQRSTGTVLGYLTQPIGGVITNPGNSVLKDLSTSRQGYLPHFNEETCIHCAACEMHCPDFCFVWEEGEDKRGRAQQFLRGIDYQYCKGCMKCVEVCPTGSLTREREEEQYAREHAVKHSFAMVRA